MRFQNKYLDYKASSLTAHIVLKVQLSGLIVLVTKLGGNNMISLFHLLNTTEDNYNSDKFVSYLISISIF